MRIPVLIDKNDRWFLLIEEIYSGYVLTFEIMWVQQRIQFFDTSLDALLSQFKQYQKFLAEIYRR